MQELLIKHPAPCIPTNCLKPVEMHKWQEKRRNKFKDLRIQQTQCLSVLLQTHSDPNRMGSVWRLCQCFLLATMYVHCSLSNAVMIHPLSSTLRFIDLPYTLPIHTPTNTHTHRHTHSTSIRTITHIHACTYLRAHTIWGSGGRHAYLQRPANWVVTQTHTLTDTQTDTHTDTEPDTHTHTDTQTDTQTRTQ